MRELLYILSMVMFINSVCKQNIFNEEALDNERYEELHVSNMGRPEMSKFVAEALRDDNKISGEEYLYLLKQNKKMQKEEMDNVFGKGE